MMGQNPIILIPARMASMRLPNKPLAPICGLPMIVQVLKRAQEADCGRVVVAAAEAEIAEAVTQAGGEAILTDPDLPSGSDRIHAVVQVVFDPAQISFDEIMKIFWENHDPTQGMRQGNDVGTQYRSGIYCLDAAQKTVAEASRDMFQSGLTTAGFDAITTEIVDAPAFYYAEDYHQQYLGKNPNGYCGMGGTGVSCPIGLTG